MKNILIVAILALLAACTTTGNTIQLGNLPPLKIIPPAQLAADVCPVLQAELPILSIAIPDPAIQANLAIVIPAINLACANAQSIKVVDLQTFVNKGIPVLISAVNASTLPIDKKQRIVASIALANALIAPVIQSLEQGTATVVVTPVPTK